jgi:hypothetical protein
MVILRASMRSSLSNASSWALSGPEGVSSGTGHLEAGREEPGVDHAPVRHQDSPLHRVLQLPNVAGPVVRHEEVDGRASRGALMERCGAASLYFSMK